MKTCIAVTGAPGAVGPYAQGVVAGDFLYLSGQIALDPASGLLVEGGIEAQVTRVMDNLGAVLAGAGLTFADLVKVTIYLVDMNDFPVVNQVYGRYLPQPYPARATVGVAALPKGALVEVEGVAWLGRTG